MFSKSKKLRVVYEVPEPKQHRELAMVSVKRPRLILKTELGMYFFLLSDLGAFLPLAVMAELPRAKFPW